MKRHRKNYFFVVTMRSLLFVIMLIIFYQLSISLLVSADEMAAKLNDECNNVNRPKYMNKETCYSKKFEYIAFKRGPEYSFSILFQLQKMDKDARGCHFISHGIGTGTYNRKPEEWQKQINSINPTCGYGAVHGIIESYINSLSGENFTKEFISTLCGTNPRGDCNHIIGHLTLVEKEGDINSSLEMCSIFRDDYQRMFCLTGVFMEHQTAVNLIAHGYAPESWLNWPARVGDLEKLCRSYQGENASACWKEITHAALVKFHHDPNKIFDFCNGAQLAEGAKGCKRHAIGIMAAGKNFDIESLKYICTIKQPTNDPTFENECYAILVSSKLFYTLPKESKDVVSFCSSLKDEFRSSCFQQIGFALSGRGASKEDIEEICGVAPGEFKSQCLYGSRLKNRVVNEAADRIEERFQ